MGKLFIFRMSTWWLPDFFDLIADLAWPLVSLCIFLCLKKPIFSALAKIKKYQYKDHKVDFEHESKKITDEIKKIELDVGRKPENNQDSYKEKNFDPLREFLFQFSVVSKYIDKIVTEYALTKGSAIKGFYMLYGNEKDASYEYLVDKKILSIDEIQILKQLKEFRNRLIHEPSYFESITIEQIEFLKRIRKILKSHIKN